MTFVLRKSELRPRSGVAESGTALAVQARSASASRKPRRNAAAPSAETAASSRPERTLVGILALLAMSWLANTLRVIAIVVAAVSYGSEFAMGAFHQVGGWLVLAAMFALCCGTFALLRRLPFASPPKSPA